MAGSPHPDSPGGLTRWLKGRSSLISLCLLLLLWEGSASLQLAGPSLLPKPAEVARVLVSSAKGGISPEQNVFTNALATIGRTLAGWAQSLLIGLILGLAIGSMYAAYLSSEFVLEFFRSIPPILALPLFLVAFNYGDKAYILTVVFGCLPIMILTVARGTQAISGEKMDLLRVYDVSFSTRAFAMGMEVLPSFFMGARLTLSVALIIAVVTEMVFTPRSGIALGSLAKDAEISFNTPLFYGAVVVIGAFGYAANALMRRIEQWFGGNSGQEV
ncbi:MAG: ABC transporter permease [Blastocatellia bacterium]